MREEIKEAYVTRVGLVGDDEPFIRELKRLWNFLNRLLFPQGVPQIRGEHHDQETDPRSACCRYRAWLIDNGVRARSIDSRTDSQRAYCHPAGHDGNDWPIPPGIRSRADGAAGHDAGYAAPSVLKSARQQLNQLQDADRRVSREES